MTVAVATGSATPEAMGAEAVAEAAVESWEVATGNDRSSVGSGAARCGRFHISRDGSSCST